MTEPTSNSPWLTQESYDKLKAELEALYENRPLIAAEINERREEGDLRKTLATTLLASSRARRKHVSATSRICFSAPPSVRFRRSPAWLWWALWSTFTTTAMRTTPKTFLIGTRGADSSNPNLETFLH